MSENSSERPKVFIGEVHLKGFKSIDDINIDLKKGLNILIGKNGSGKSNFLEFLNQIINPFTKQITYEYSKIDFEAADGELFAFEKERSLRTSLSDSNRFNQRVKMIDKFYVGKEMVFDNTEDENLSVSFPFKMFYLRYPSNNYILFDNMGYDPLEPVYIKFDINDNLAAVQEGAEIKINIKEVIRSAVPETLAFLFDIFWDIVGDFSRISADGLLLNPPKDKINLKNISRKLKIQKTIIANLKQYSPVEDLRFNKNINLYEEENDILIDNIKLEFKINDNWLPWSQLSDGTKRIFIIITEITHSKSVVLIEEPELGIHPHQFHLLMNFLKEQAEQKQIIISTHSPKALDILSQDELDNILIASYEKKKGTQIRHLKPAEVKKAQKYMNEVGFLSDYWMHSDLEE